MDTAQVKNSVGIWAFGRKGIETLKCGVDLAAQLGAHFIIWPGAEGYNYNFQRDLAMTLQDVNYGAQGQRIGYDLYPYTEDQVAAVRRSAIQWTFIDDLARKIDRHALNEARSHAMPLRATAWSMKR